MNRGLLLFMFVAASLAASGGRPWSDAEILDQSWRGWRSRFVTGEGRVVRPDHGGDTVSEGQAYTMLRAAWMGDQATFDRVWAWTRARLSRTGRPAPHLLAWRWAPGADGRGRVADWEPATDADEDYGLALLVAARTWKRPTLGGLPSYEGEARAVLRDLLDFAVARDAAGAEVFLPGLWARSPEADGSLILNPSYLSPGWYRVFAAWTGDARWEALVASSYVVLGAACGSPSGPLRAVPDWIRWRSAEGWAPRDETTKSGWDAVRVAWRVGSDAAWFPTGESAGWVSRCLSPGVRTALDSGSNLPVERDLDGRDAGPGHPLAAAMAAFAMPPGRDRDRLLDVAAASLRPHPGRQLFFESTDRYYVNSLAWLPFALRAGRYRAPLP